MIWKISVSLLCSTQDGKSLEKYTQNFIMGHIQEKIDLKIEFGLKLQEQTTNATDA